MKAGEAGNAYFRGENGKVEVLAKIQ